MSVDLRALVVVATARTKYRKITSWPQFSLDRSALRTVSQPHIHDVQSRGRGAVYAI